MKLSNLLTYIFCHLFLIGYAQNPDSMLLEGMRINDQEMILAACNTGANPDLTDENGNTALHWSAKNNNWVLASFLIDHYAADIDIINKNNQNAYDLAKENNAADALFCLDSTDVCIARINCAMSMGQIDTLSNKGLYLDAINMSKSSIDYCEEGYGENSMFVITLLSKQSDLYKEIYNLEKHLECLLIIKEKIFAGHNDNKKYCIWATVNLATAYYSAGYNNKALSHYIMAMEDAMKYKIMDDNQMQGIFTGMAKVYMKFGKYEEALGFMNDALEIVKNKLGENSIEYAHKLSQLAEIRMEMKEYDLTISLSKKSNDIYKKSLKESNQLLVDYAMNLNHIGYSYQKLNQFKESIPYLEESDKIIVEIGSSIENLLNSKERLMATYEHIGNHDKVLEINILLMDIIGSNLINYTSSLPEKEILKLLININSHQHMTLSNIKNITDESAKELKIKFYESYLMTTALAQLGMTRNKAAVQSINSEELKEKYNEYITIRKELYQLSLMNKNEEINKKIEELEEKEKRIERGISESSHDLGKYVNNNKYEISFKDLSDNIPKKSAVIDFVELLDYEREDVMIRELEYTAIITKSGAEESIFISLGNKEKINKILAYEIGAEEGMSYVDNSAETAKELYQLIFQPLEKELKGIEEIYISFAGRLHEISMNVLVREDGGFLGDKYQLHFCNSIRDFVIKRKQGESSAKNNKQSIALFGNANFDTEIKNVSQNTKRANFSPLPGTKEEIESISKLAKAKGITTQVFTEENASEKQLISTVKEESPSILHIATHGYSLKETTLDTLAKTNMGERLSNQANPLFRSGIILSGGNTTWKSEKILDEAEDGIVTAYEIINMNLSSTDLVVLSACSTGKGNVFLGEGVYGLQRAFKIAGVKNMIVSLWDVHDTATKLLMEKFYRHYFSGTGLYESLRLAQNEMRETAEYSDPIYWAGFILVE